MLLSASLLLIIFIRERHKQVQTYIKTPDLCPIYEEGWIGHSDWCEVVLQVFYISYN